MLPGSRGVTVGVLIAAKPASGRGRLAVWHAFSSSIRRGVSRGFPHGDQQCPLSHSDCGDGDTGTSETRYTSNGKLAKVTHHSSILAERLGPTPTCARHGRTKHEPCGPFTCGKGHDWNGSNGGVKSIIQNTTCSGRPRGRCSRASVRAIDLSTRRKIWDVKWDILYQLTFPLQLDTGNMHL